MSVSSVHPKMFPFESFMNKVWEKSILPLRVRSGTGMASILNGNTKTAILEDTQLNFSIDTEVGSLENRKAFIMAVTQDILKHCPQDEPLAVICPGSGSLLLEFMIGKILIENGYEKITFFLIDPSYAFAPAENKSYFNTVLTDFRTQIEKVYLKKWKHPLLEDQIRFLSRMQNVSKYFSQNSNVVVIQALPPYAENIATMRENKAFEKKPEDLFTGNHIVPEERANAITFIPGILLQQLKAQKAKLDSALPLCIFTPAKIPEPFYFDWGCKIETNGDYRLSFTGQEYFHRSLGLAGDRMITTNKGTVPANQLISTAQKAMDEFLKKEIGALHKPLIQENITSLLKQLKQMIDDYTGISTCFFLSDYTTDFRQMSDDLAKNAGHHYRKMFTLAIDINRHPAISVEEIRSPVIHQQS